MLKSEELSDEEKEMYRALFYRSTATSNMLEEMRQIKRNASIVSEGGVPSETPMYFFISNGKEIGMSQWEKLQAEYMDKVQNGKLTTFNSGH